jgi:hypothetical protein
MIVSAKALVNVADHERETTGILPDQVAQK